MKWLMVKNDIKRNKIINLVLLLFMLFSASLAVLSVFTGVQTLTSISKLYRTAEPPHFLQMHKGDLNQKEIDEFMSSQEEVVYWQTQRMINIYGENLTIVNEEESYDLSDLRLDIGMVKQNQSKDLLLNSEHERIILEEGEIGIPIILKTMYDIDIGDRVILRDNNFQDEFTIKEFVLDSQMNSSMTSSTRILLSDVDYERLSGQIGEYEYLIEAYFTNTDEASSFQTIYENSGLPRNGQAVTYTMIFLLSALIDIVMVFIMLLVSVLLIIISFICVRFTIMATLEEEIYEIGTMKAIGFNYRDIRAIYLDKYRIIAIIAVIIGYILAILLSNIFTRHITTTFGNTKVSILAIILSIVVGIKVYLLIIYYCKKILKRIKKLTVVEALVTGIGFDKNAGEIRDGLYKSKKLPLNWLMGMREVFYKFKNWAIVFAIALITVMMIMISVNLLNTFEAPEFITYMGSSLEDILIEVEAGENLDKGYRRTKEVVESDEEIKDYYEYKRVSVKTRDSDDKIMNLHIDSGVNSGSDLQYLRGQAPQESNEIAISYLNADRMQKKPGDRIRLIIDHMEEKEFIISGVYQDVSSGGYTAKSRYEFPKLQALKYTFSVNLIDKSNVNEKADELSANIGLGVKVDPMEDFINQTLGGVSRQLRVIVIAIAIIGASMAMLISVLFLKLRLAKDISDIAILRAMGFSSNDIKEQYMIKIGLVASMGILAGIVSSNFLGERLINLGLSISGLGINRIQLISNPIIQYLVSPILLISLVLIVTRLVIREIEEFNIISVINE